MICALTANDWTALGTWAVALATGLIVFFGRQQIKALRDENKKARAESRKLITLEACGQYEFNPVIHQCRLELWAAKVSGDLDADPKKFYPQIVVLLNYLDAMAIGIKQGLYLQALAREHLEHIVEAHVTDYIESGYLEKATGSRDYYETLLELRQAWKGPREAFRNED